MRRSLAFVLVFVLGGAVWHLARERVMGWTGASPAPRLTGGRAERKPFIPPEGETIMITAPGANSQPIHYHLRIVDSPGEPSKTWLITLLHFTGDDTKAVTYTATE